MGGFIPVIDLDLQRGPQCAREARTAIQECVPEGPIRDSLEVIASELVTNAFVHGYGDIHCLLLHDGSDYRIEVSNGSDEVELDSDGNHVGLNSEEHDSEGGRGLTVVQSLCSDFGSTFANNCLTVWAVLSDQSA